MTIRPDPRLLAALCLLMLSACSAQTLPRHDPGPFEVSTADGITLRDPVQQRDVSFRVMYPAGPGSFPVVVFSAGGFCRPAMYDRITAHWVSHGYVVVEPLHMDSPDHGRRLSDADMALLLPTRLRDASFALDALDQIGRAAGIADRLDPGHVAIAGHSFGAAIASMKSGLILREQYRGPWGDARDGRFQAAVLLSAPGSGEELAENAFDGLRGPLMATGGTADVGRGYDPSMPPGDWRRQMYLRSPPGDKYSVIVEGADHFLGGLICDPERGGDPDPGAVEIVRAMTTSFLDAYLKDDPAARRFLLTADIASLTADRADYRFR